MRAVAYGVEREELPGFYRNRTILKVEVTAEDPDGIAAMTLR